MTAPSPDAEALIERRGRAGVIVLNRPKALNALTLTMVRLIAAALDEWDGDDAVDRIVLIGAGRAGLLRRRRHPPPLRPRPHRRS